MEGPEVEILEGGLGGRGARKSRHTHNRALDSSMRSDNH